ncbi:MAG TPA: dihydrofolate reductase family protein [Longimicrobiales bacterium]
MRKLVINTFLTLDGVMQAPGAPEEDPSGGFEYGGWSVNYWDEKMGEIMDAAMAEPFDLLLGRRTYEIFAAHWPHSTEDPAATQLNSARKYVASRTLDRADWQNSTLIRNVPREVATLKEQSGPEIQVHGSSDLIQTLLRHELIDAMRLWTFPLVVGSGKRLFAGGTLPRGLRLTDSAVSTTGVVIATYERAGAIEPGSFALETPTPAELERRAGLSG